MSSEAFDTLPPTSNTMQMLNAVRVAAVNANHPGTITYDPFKVLVPQNISAMQMLNAIRLALEGEIQS
jgi:hypothetical protein